MSEKNSNIFKLSAYISLFLLLCCLIPICLLGKYNHPLGDDYHYGQYARIALSQTGSIAEAIKAAAEGTARQYEIWQGTYSAMFFMHLAPNVFGDFFYKLYPTVLILSLVGGVFFLLFNILVHFLNVKKDIWVIISSILSFLFLEQVPLMGETFFWYNGSMYYTGFFALTLFFFGGILSFIHSPKKCKIILLSLAALFLAGGNYASLLPAMEILFLFILYNMLIKKNKQNTIGLSIVFLNLLAGFIISVIAPGNVLRQDTSYGTTPILAILKSIRQALLYLRGWSNIWLFIGLMLLTPVFIAIVKESDFSFRYPLLVIVISFGIFASASCPTFYAQNNGGAARVFDLSWYMMVLLISGGYFYLLGFLTKKFSKKEGISNESKFLILCEISIVALFAIMLLIRPLSETYIELNSIHCLKAITSGDAKYYDSQYRARLSVLNDPSVTECIFDPYDVPESLIYVLHLGDLSDDPRMDSNVNFADYYGKSSVRLRTNP